MRKGRKLLKGDIPRIETLRETKRKGLSDNVVNPCMFDSPELTTLTQVIEREHDFIEEYMSFEKQVQLRHTLMSLHGRKFDSAESKCMLRKLVCISCLIVLG